MPFCGGAGSYPGDAGYGGQSERSWTNPGWVYVEAVRTTASVDGATFTDVSGNVRYLKAMKSGGNRPLLIRDIADQKLGAGKRATETHPAIGVPDSRACGVGKPEERA